MSTDVYLENLKISELDENESIYHYTSASALMNIIKANEFWVTNGKYLNDYTEISYIEEVFKETCLKIMATEEKGDLLYKEIMSLYSDFEKISPTYILSFSTNKDSIALWSEFSNFYGYNMEFNISDLRNKIFLDNKSYDYYIQEGKVIYDKQQQIAILEKEILGMWYTELEKEEIEARIEVIKEYNPNTTLTKERLMNPIPLTKIFDEEYRDKLNEYNGEFYGIAMILSVYAPFFKRNCFKDEYEYRYIFLPEFYDKAEKNHPMYCDGVLFREKDGVIIPYIKINLKYDKKKIPIKSIMVGSKNNSDLAMKGTRYYLDKNNYTETDIIKSEISLRY